MLIPINVAPKDKLETFVYVNPDMISHVVPFYYWDHEAKDRKPDPEFYSIHFIGGNYSDDPQSNTVTVYQELELRKVVDNNLVMLAKEEPQKVAMERQRKIQSRRRK